VATSADGLVEAMESSGHRWVMGIQWHPERPEVAIADAEREDWTASVRSLWQAFAAACYQ
jgi:gamma-glutamyl-gamma-aminobutyrate hydrolase PuuD